MERKKKFETISGINLEPYYETSHESKSAELGKPGEYPYTRGVQKSMYRGKLWTFRQYGGFGTAKATNERYKYLLSQGSTGLSVAFDLPTQMGRDSDDPRAQGEVGKVGVAINTIEDIEQLFDGIPLEKISVSMTINATAHILLSLYLVLARRRGINWNELQGTIQNDILKEYIARGTYIYPPRAALRIVTDVFEFCSTAVPKWNTISVSGYHIREAGSNAVQELAFTLADGITYVEGALSRGLKIDDFAPRIAFFFNCHNQFLEEIAKFRAARRLWAKIAKERFGAKSEKSLHCRFHTQTAGSSLTAQQPLNNIVRTTIQAMAAVLGGTQSLHTNSYDEALGLPTENSAEIAIRTQQIIAEESGLADVIDPLGGSYLIEKLTDELEKRALEYIERIDKRGGMVRAIEEGYPQQEIEEAAYRYQKQIEDNEIKIVGVNAYQTVEKNPPMVLKIDPLLEKDQLTRLATFKAKRDANKVQEWLKKIENAAKGAENLLPLVVEAVDAHATLGEISDVLRGVWGEHH